MTATFCKGRCKPLSLETTWMTGIITKNRYTSAIITTGDIGMTLVLEQLWSPVSYWNMYW